MTLRDEIARSDQMPNGVLSIYGDGVGETSAEYRGLGLAYPLP